MASHTIATYTASTAIRSTSSMPSTPVPSWRVTNAAAACGSVRHRRAERREGDEPLVVVVGTARVLAAEMSSSPVVCTPCNCEDVQEVLAARPLHLQDHVEREARAAEPGAALLLGHELPGGDLVAAVEVRGLVDATEVRHDAHEVPADHDREHEERARRVAEDAEHAAAPSDGLSAAIAMTRRLLDGVDDEHAAGSVVRHRVGHAAEEAAPALHPPVADDDEVGLEVGGDVAEHLGRAAEAGVGLDRVTPSRSAVSAARPSVASSSPLISSSQLRSAATGAAAAISPAAMAVGERGFWTVTMWSTASGWVAASSAAASTAFDALAAVGTHHDRLEHGLPPPLRLGQTLPAAVRVRRSARISASWYTTASGSVTVPRYCVAEVETPRRAEMCASPAHTT